MIRRLDRIRIDRWRSALWHSLPVTSLVAGATRVRQGAATRWVERTVDSNVRHGTLLGPTTRTQRHKGTEGLSQIQTSASG